MSERPVVYSASSVNAYLDCHLRWYFSYVLGEPGIGSEAQRVGIKIHDFAERSLKNLGARYLTDDPEIESLVWVWNNHILPTYRWPLLIEEPFQITVNDIGFSGIIDSLDQQDVGEQSIVDWDSEGRDMIDPYPVYANILRDLKSTGKRPPAGKYRFNMIGYYLGVTEGLGLPVHAMQLDYIVRTQRPYYWPEVVPLPDEEDIQEFAVTLERVAEGVARSDYEPTGLGTYVCGYCPHRTVCGPYQRYQEITE
jgi:PD-(D/E)XK nuclease superfamily